MKNSQTRVQILMDGPPGQRKSNKLIRLLQLQKEVMQEDGEDENA